MSSILVLFYFGAWDWQCVMLLLAVVECGKLIRPYKAVYKLTQILLCSHRIEVMFSVFLITETNLG